MPRGKGQGADERWKLLGYPFFLSGESSGPPRSFAMLLRSILNEITRSRRALAKRYAITQAVTPILVRMCELRIFFLFANEERSWEGLSITMTWGRAQENPRALSFALQFERNLKPFRFRYDSIICDTLTTKRCADTLENARRCERLRCETW